MRWEGQKISARTILSHALHVSLLVYSRSCLRAPGAEVPVPQVVLVWSDKKPLSGGPSAQLVRLANHIWQASSTSAGEQASGELSRHACLLQASDTREVPFHWRVQPVFERMAVLCKGARLSRKGLMTLIGKGQCGLQMAVHWHSSEARSLRTAVMRQD